jgi:GMP synthase (glutamine-hydrolysing)
VKSYAEISPARCSRASPKEKAEVRLHLLLHDPFDCSRNHLTAWAEEKGYRSRESYVCNGDALPAMDEFDWLVIMGASLHAWEEDLYPWLLPEKEFIAGALNQRKMILGICFGAQLIAEAKGARVFPSPYKEIGWYPVHLTREGEQSFLFRNIPKTFVSFHWHSDHFSLPPGCTRLAYSEASPNQAFICNDQPFVCLQFHPEFTREIVLSFSRERSEEWIPDRFVSGKEAVISQTRKMKDNYGLMKALLDNMDNAFG